MESQTFNLYENLVFTTPPIPESNKIAGHDLPIKQQKWVRPEIPKNFEFLPEEEQEQYAFQQDEYCDKGYWFYNHGVPTYLTGDNYYYLTYFKLDVGFPEYRDVDRRWFYVWDICDKDPECLGLIYLKKRRDGFSYRAMSIILNRARKTFNSQYGMMSKTGEDAKELFAKVVYAFKELAPFFKPQVHSAEDVKKELHFDNPAQRVTFKNRKITKQGIALNTKISYRNTSDNSYDSMKLKIIVGDESGKMEEADFEKWHKVVGTCLKLGNINIIGKAIYGTTVNEPEKETTIRKRVGSNGFENIWKKSSSTEKVSMGRTISELYRYIVPSYDGLEGFVGEYGESIIENPTPEQIAYLSEKHGKKIDIGSKQYLDGVRKALQDSGDLKGYYEFCRQFPYNSTEAFRRGDNKDSAFDLSKIYQQLEYNATLPLSTVIRGNLVWVERPRKVKFVETPQGRWGFVRRMKDDEANKWITVQGKQTPANHHIKSGVDPYDNDIVGDYRRSSGCSHVGMKYDPNDANIRKLIISEYHARPPKALLFYEDILMQCVYFGCQILIEPQKIGLIKHFREAGLHNYLMWRPDFTHTDWTRKNTVEVGLSLAAKETRDLVISILADYIYDFVGFNNETKQFGNFYFDDTLQECIIFDVHKWTPYDRVVSLMETLCAMQTEVKQKSTNDDGKQFFRTYKIVGNKSVEVSQGKSVEQEIKQQIISGITK